STRFPSPRSSGATRTRWPRTPISTRRSATSRKPDRFSIARSTISRRRHSRLCSDENARLLARGPRDDPARTGGDVIQSMGNMIGAAVGCGGGAMRIGVVGAGMIGSTLAKLWIDAGHDVRVASRHPDELKPLVDRLGARASAGTPLDAATFGDVVMLTVPLKAIPNLARDLAEPLAGKVVLDTSNAYVQRDGDSARDASAHPGGSAAWAAAMFPRSRWVKAFNTVYFKTLETEAGRQGDRIGIPLAGDDPGA